MLPVVYGSPRYVAKQPNIPPVGSAHKRKLLRKFLAQAVKRYGKGGIYWTAPKLYRRQHPGKRPRPIDELADLERAEPRRSSSRPVRRCHKYATLVRSAHRAIHGADHKANVILAGMSGEGHPSDKKFLNRFYRQRRIKRSFDAVAVNPYAPSVTQVGAKIKRIRGVMKPAPRQANPPVDHRARLGLAPAGPVRPEQGAPAARSGSSRSRSG